MGQSKGFTLIEILIVIVLIGIMSGMTMLTIGSGGQRDQQQQEAEQLKQLLQMASDEAGVQGEPLALEYNAHGYRFLALAKGRWQADIKDALFRPRTLHPQLALELKVDNKPVTLQDTDKYALAVRPRPHIVFMPDGDMTLFQLKLMLPDSDEVVTVANTLKDGLIVNRQSLPSRL
jgi:general secretion pathway protein H